MTAVIAAVGIFLVVVAAATAWVNAIDSNHRQYRNELRASEAGFASFDEMQLEEALDQGMNGREDPTERAKQRAWLIAAIATKEGK